MMRVTVVSLSVFALSGCAGGPAAAGCPVLSGTVLTGEVVPDGGVRGNWVCRDGVGYDR